MSFTQDITLRGTHGTRVPLRPAPEAMAAEIERRLALQRAGSMLPFAVLDVRGRAVGMTSFMNIDSTQRRVEIGSTWYRASVQRSALNTECKRLLLGHALETLDCIAVELRTHSLNHQSRRGIERLGAKPDGIVAAEWPTVRAHLDHQLRRPRDTSDPSARLAATPQPHTRDVP